MLVQTLEQFLHLLSLGSLPIRSRSDYDPMALGETRKFKIDKTKKTNCELPGPRIVEIEIIKEKSVFSAKFRKFRFKMKDSDDNAFVDCDAGSVSLLKVQGSAEQCGIGKILVILCLKEKEIHNVANKDINKAMKIMDDYIEDCQEEEGAVCKAGKLQELKKWIKCYCSKVMYLEMLAQPLSAAHVYFRSAIASGFTEMFILTNNDGDTFYAVDQYPKEGPCSVEMLHARYTNDGYMEVDGGERVLVWGRNWFFCHPKNFEKKPKCTIL